MILPQDHSCGFSFDSRVGLQNNFVITRRCERAWKIVKHRDINSSVSVYRHSIIINDFWMYEYVFFNIRIASLKYDGNQSENGGTFSGCFLRRFSISVAGVLVDAWANAMEKYISVTWIFERFFKERTEKAILQRIEWDWPRTPGRNDRERLIRTGNNVDDLETTGTIQGISNIFLSHRRDIVSVFGLISTGNVYVKMYEITRDSGDNRAKSLSFLLTVTENFLLRGASPVNGSKNRYFFFIIIRLHMHSDIRM